MTMLNKMVSAILLAALAAPACSAPVKPAPGSAPLTLKDGVNDLKIGDMPVRIIKAFVSNGTASSFDTYSVFVMPAKQSERWLQVTVPNDTGIGFNFRTYESGDSNLQFVSFYQQGGKLFAVTALKTGQVPEVNLKPAPVDFKVYSFNQDWDLPKFDNEGVMHAQSKYLNAEDALAKEFYSKKNSR